MGRTVSRGAARTKQTGRVVDLAQLVSHVYLVVIVLIVCVAAVVIVRMLLDHKERSDQRRDRVLNTPLEKFSDHDEAELLAQKYEDGEYGAARQGSARGGRCEHEGRRATLPQININIGSNNSVHSNNAGSYNGSNFRTGPACGRYDGNLGRHSAFVAFFLCVFLGWAGGHRFYCGSTGLGVLYLFTGGLFGIGWLVDLVRIVTGGFTDAEGRRLR
jgi:hypothetical protein